MKAEYYLQGRVLIMIRSVKNNDISTRWDPSCFGGKTFIEYFAGIGLFRMALETLGWTPIFANDISYIKKDIYNGFYNDELDHYVVEDIFNLKTDSIPKALLATAGFPCIDLSLAGNQSGVINGKHSSAFWGLIDILKSQGDNSPPLIILENVPGWLSSNKGEDFRLTIQALNGVGYACDVFVLDALRFTPQSRQRVFLIGNKTDSHDFNVEKLDIRSQKLKTKRLMDAITTNSDLNWQFLDIPEPPDHLDNGLNHIVERIKLGDGRWWSNDEVIRHLDMMTDSHKDRINKLAKKSNVNYRTFYRRVRNGSQRSEVRKGETAGCLRTAAGGSSKQFIIAAGLGKINMRNMTSKEYARLQGVPDKYIIYVPENDALTGFGDAVCVPVIEWIGKNVLPLLLDEE